MYLYIKRFLDIILSLIALTVLSPLLIPIIIMLKLTGEGYIFYVQKRVGYKGKTFQLLKFATMLKDSPNLGTGTITTQNDPRVLPAGKFLRKTKINELPQIINVLLGKMSIVGPRPQTQECFDFFPIKDKDKILRNKPGVTGIGSIVFRDEEEIIGKSNKSYNECYGEDIMPHKAKLEIWYLNNKSLVIDLKIIFLTAWCIIFQHSKLYLKVFKNLPTTKRDQAR